jgi:hypothetical protein
VPIEVGMKGCENFSQDYPVVELEKPTRIHSCRKNERRDFLLDFKHAVKKQSTEWKIESSFDNTGQTITAEYIRGSPCTVAVQGEPEGYHGL